MLEAEERSNYPFALSVDDFGEGFRLTAEVDVSMEPSRVCAFVECALEALAMALEHAPETPLCELDILPPAEKQQLLVDWNAPAARYRRPASMVCSNAGGVDAGGNRGAVQRSSPHLRRSQARANQLAHALIEQGVLPDQPVAVALERSPR